MIGSRRICILPRLSGVGGMVSFRAKLLQGLADRGVETCDDLADAPYQSILVIGGTRDLPGLRRARRGGVRIVQRLDGMNWLHRRRRTGLRHFLKAEYGNVLLSLIRIHLADSIVYQSNFSQGWWERQRGPTRASHTVIYNGVDLQVYHPEGPHQRPQDRSRILLVEGNLGGGYETGLETALQMAQMLNSRTVTANLPPVEVMVVGHVSSSLVHHFQSHSSIPLVFTGLVPPQAIPEIDRSAHVLFAADINAACPNSTIEALACGLPVISFDTGALPELVDARAGCVVPYGGDPWRLEPPDLQSLADGAIQVLGDQALYREGARRRAEALFSLDRMVASYLEALQGS